jgi:hypothetical protein
MKTLIKEKLKMNSNKQEKNKKEIKKLNKSIKESEKQIEKDLSYRPENNSDVEGLSYIEE